MLIGRFLFIVPDLAMAGSLVRRSGSPPSAGHVPDDTGRCSSGCLVGVILIVGALTYFPALSLGPIVEHLMMHGREGCSEMEQ